MTNPTYPNRILVCGGRDYADREFLFHKMNYYSQYFAPGFCIIQGGAKGADRLAADWAKAKGVPCITMYAPWDAYGKKAGSIRNGWMLKYCNPDLVLAFPGGYGTSNMIDKAEDKNITVELVTK